MPKICYQAKSFKTASTERISQANEIIAEYRAQGFVLTLRQLYYQFVRRNWLTNTDKSYDNLGALMTDARLAGLVDWSAIEDRTRSLKGNNHWGSPNEIIDACANQFMVSRWEHQTYQPEIWVEKEALAGIFERIGNELDVPYFSCRGYGSASEMWRAGRRMKGYLDAGKKPIIFHFGDHDPSGMDMTRDITDRLALFAEDEIEVVRVALNMNQVEEYGPPPNPAKVTDSRAAGYIELYGEYSWELDALEPQTLMDMAEERILAIRDDDEWDRTGRVQEKGRDDLKKVANKWDEVLNNL